MIDLLKDSEVIHTFVAESAKRIGAEGLAPVRAFGIQCSALDGIISSAYDMRAARRESRYSEIIPEWDVVAFEDLCLAWDQSYYGVASVQVRDCAGCLHVFGSESSDTQIVKSIFECLKQIIEPLVPMILAKTGASIVALEMAATDLSYQWSEKKEA